MNIENKTLNHSITIYEYNDLSASVDFITIRENRARIALNHSLYTLIARENGRSVGMARVVGDGGYVYFICDVIVRPSHQSQGLGRYIIEHVLSWLESQVDEGETIMVNLMSPLNKETRFSHTSIFRPWLRYEPLDFPLGSFPFDEFFTYRFQNG